MWDEYVIEQQINDRSVLIDPVLVASAIEIDARARVQAEERMRRITEIDNPNSIKQITVWLATRGVEADSLASKAEGYETSFSRKD